MNTISEDAQKWFESRTYLNGLELEPHETVDVAEFARQYAANQEEWDTMFAFLKNTDLHSLSVGKHAIEGSDIYIAVSESENKELDKAAWESHRKAIDLQYVIEGGEGMGVTPIGNATVTIPYNEAKDIVFYEAEGPIYTAVPGSFFLFFPNDAHRPMIKAEGYPMSKKIVIKVRAV